MERLTKELAFPGEFRDCLGQEVTLTREYLELLVAGTLSLMAHGLKIPCYTSHFTDDSADILGYWRRLWMEGESLYGEVEPLDEAAAARLAKIDTSIFFEDQVSYGTRDGVVAVPMAITRIDAVGQGAVVGTGPFTQSGALLSGQRAGLSSKRARFLLAMEKTMDLKNKDDAASEAQVPGEGEGEVAAPASLMAALASAFGLGDGDVEPDVLEKLFMSQVLGLQDPSGDELSEAVESLIRDGAAAMAAYKAGADVPPAEEPSANPEMAELMEEVQELRGLAVESLFSEANLAKADEKRIRATFDDLRKRAGFKSALSVTQQMVSFAKPTIPQGSRKHEAPAGGAGDTKKTKVAARPPESKGQSSETFAKAMSGENPVLKAAEALGLVKPVAPAGQKAS